MLLDGLKKTLFPLLPGDTGNARHQAVVLLARRLSNIPIPQRNARNKYRFTYQYLRQEWVQGGHRPGAEFEAAQASTFPLLASNLNFILQNWTVNNTKARNCVMAFL